MKGRWETYDITGKLYAVLSSLPQRPWVRVDDLAVLFAAYHGPLVRTLGYPLSNLAPPGHPIHRRPHRSLARYLQDGLAKGDPAARGIETGVLYQIASGTSEAIYRAGGDVHGPDL